MAKKHHASKEDLPVKDLGIAEIHSAEWGEYSVRFFKETTEKGDMSPLHEGLPDNLCPVPHWGYVFKGKIVMKYRDREETISAGDAFYMEPGHVPIFMEEGTEWLIFSPKKEMDEVWAVVMGNMKKMEEAR